MQYTVIEQAPDFEINPHGCARNIETREAARAIIGNDGHWYVRLRLAPGSYVLRPVRNLVALAWMPGAKAALALDDTGRQQGGRRDGARVVHLDGDPSHNWVSNLAIRAPPAVVISSDTAATSGGEQQAAAETEEKAAVVELEQPDHLPTRPDLLNFDSGSSDDGCMPPPNQPRRRRPQQQQEHPSGSGRSPSPGPAPVRRKANSCYSLGAAYREDPMMATAASPEAKSKPKTNKAATAQMAAAAGVAVAVGAVGEGGSKEGPSWQGAAGAEVGGVVTRSTARRQRSL